MKKRVNKSRRESGFVGVMLLLVALMIVLLFSIIAVDVAHFSAAGAELQCAADSAAMMGAYDLQWQSTGTDIFKATMDAQYMAQHAAADVYSPGGNPFPANSVTVSFSSLNGGTNNAVTVSITPPVMMLFTPLLGTATQYVGVSATAERVPVLGGPAPPWFLETTAQVGPSSPPPLPSPSPAPPTTFPTNGYITFADDTASSVGLAPPITPTYWVDMGLSNLSTAQPNPSGVQQVLQCLGHCVTNSSCNTTNPIVVNGSIIYANHGAYNSNVSNPSGNASSWTDGRVTILPITTAGNVVGLYVVKLTGPYVKNSSRNGQGVFGEFGIQFVGSADTLPGVTAMDTGPGNVYTNVGATIAVLVN